MIEMNVNERLEIVLELCRFVWIHSQNYDTILRYCALIGLQKKEVHTRRNLLNLKYGVASQATNTKYCGTFHIFCGIKTIKNDSFKWCVKKWMSWFGCEVQYRYLKIKRASLNDFVNLSGKKNRVFLLRLHWNVKIKIKSKGRNHVDSS